MRHYRKRLDVYDIKQATFNANDYITLARDRLENYDHDDDRDKRLERRWCRTCFYIVGGGIAGQAFTEWNCRACGKVDMYHCTATPQLCEDCAKKLQLCTRCCGDIEQRERRRKFDLESIEWKEPKEDEA